LATAVSDALTQHFLDVDVETDVANGRLLAYLAQHGEILSRTFTGDRVSVHCRLPKKYAGRIRPDEAAVRLRATAPHSNGNGQLHVHVDGNGVSFSGGPAPQQVEDVA
jgi:GTP-binding protein HflX